MGAASPASFLAHDGSCQPPRGTPAEVVAKLNDALVKALDDANTRKRLLDLGADLPDKAGRTPEALAKLVASEVARWKSVIKVPAAETR